MDFWGRAFFAIARIKSSSGAFDVKNAPSQIENDLSPLATCLQASTSLSVYEIRIV